MLYIQIVTSVEVIIENFLRKMFLARVILRICRNHVTRFKPIACRYFTLRYNNVKSCKNRYDHTTRFYIVENLLHKSYNEL